MVIPMIPAFLFYVLVQSLSAVVAFARTHSGCIIRAGICTRTIRIAIFPDGNYPQDTLHFKLQKFCGEFIYLWTGKNKGIDISERRANKYFKASFYAYKQIDWNFFIVGAIALFIPYTVLTIIFEYPMILRQDTSAILIKFHECGNTLDLDMVLFCCHRNSFVAGFLIFWADSSLKIQCMDQSRDKHRCDRINCSDDWFVTLDICSFLFWQMHLFPRRMKQQNPPPLLHSKRFTNTAEWYWANILDNLYNHLDSHHFSGLFRK